MAQLYKDDKGPAYIDKEWITRPDEYRKALEQSATVYIGNLAFFTTEEQIWELFSKIGEIKRIIMGLDSVKRTPCGFCFVEYYSHKDAAECSKYMNGIKLDDRVIRADLDVGFSEGRQFGRGKSGGQVRDEFRNNYDEGRGGYGKGGQYYSPQNQKYGQQGDYRKGGGGGGGGGYKRTSEEFNRDRDNRDFKRHRPNDYNSNTNNYNRSRYDRDNNRDEFGRDKHDNNNRDRYNNNDNEVNENEGGDDRQ
jgi:nuclear cap-binding protein subunit 2